MRLPGCRCWVILSSRQSGGGRENVERAMRRATNQEVTKLERALTFLATIASTAPL